MRKQRAETLFGVAALLFAAKMEYGKRACKRTIEEYAQRYFDQQPSNKIWDWQYPQLKRKQWHNREECLHHRLLTVKQEEEQEQD